MVAKRLGVEPTSKLGVWYRWPPTVRLPSCWGLQLDDMDAAMDLLHAHADKLEEAVFFETADVSSLEVDPVFHDTTTASFSIYLADEDGGDAPGLRKPGHSQEGTWSRRVAVALAVTRDGLPARSRVLPGDNWDVTTIERCFRPMRRTRILEALDTSPPPRILGTASLSDRNADAQAHALSPARRESAPEPSVITRRRVQAPETQA